MKILILIGLIISFSFLNAKDDVINMGIYPEGIFISKKQAMVAAKIWNTKVNNDNRYKNEVILKIYDDFDEMINLYNNKKLYSIIITPGKYYSNKEKLDKITYLKWGFIRGENTFSKFYLIKNKNFKDDIKNVKNLTILYKEEMAKNWVEYYTLKNNIKNIDFKKIEKDNKLVFNVFFKNEFSVVRQELYDTMVKLNPQIKTKVEIIKESDKIFPVSMGLDRKDFAEKYIYIHDNIKKDINENNIQLESFKHVDVNGIKVLTDDELKPLDEFYKDYLKIIGKN
ncbi:hypothetical protein [Arcobacter arenosus]|jgi:hypothetical protein|uniref:hypothetical protein n=1 Tax=Arcobacter arenosus TaxID=2576037 RepID=UPI003BA914D8